ncbi:MAG: GC-type dockerin domain-anchored protein [Phycisphaerales bacterium]|nr:GC-type dockerin domain-anchored protein [Phycisphaerales bacterium]
MLLHSAALAATFAGSGGTVITFDDQPSYLLATPESLFFRQYDSLGMTNINSSAAGGHILTFPSLQPSRTFLPPHSGSQAVWVRCAGAPLPPTQRLEFAAPQQSVSFWLAADVAVTMRLLVGAGGADPIQTLNRPLAARAWTQATISVPTAMIRTVELTPTDGTGAFQYVNWAMDDITLTASAQACGSSDIGSTGGADAADGQLNNNDFIVFIDRFFASDPRADVGATGGVPGVDGAFNNNDFVVFIDRFFAGCG